MFRTLDSLHDGGHSALRKPLSLLSLLLVAALLAPAAGATTLHRLDDAALVDGSSLIATGTCDGTRTEWIAGALFTVADVRVENVLKGGQVERIDVLLPGGIDAHREVPVVVTYPGAPTLAAGERVLLFLTPAADDGAGGALATRSALAATFTVTGFSQGKFSLLSDEPGKTTVRRDLSGLRLLDGEAVTDGGPRSATLAELHERIARLAARPYRIELGFEGTDAALGGRR